MKINEIITESNWHKGHKRTKRDTKVWHVGNEHAKIVRNTKQANSHFCDSERGAIDACDPHINLEKVRDMYGTQLVDEFLDVLELPNGIEGTDDEMSMFSKDNR